MENSAITNNQVVMYSLPNIQEKRIKEFPKNGGMSVLSNKDIQLIEIEVGLSNYRYYLTNSDLTSLTVNQKEEIIMCNLEDKEMLRLNNYLNQIELIRRTSFYLLDEGVNPPNEWALDKSKELIFELLKLKISYYQIEPSYDEGIAFIFKNTVQKMYLEIYNDGQIGYIIEDYQKKSILENNDVKSIYEAKNRVKKFIA